MAPKARLLLAAACAALSVCACLGYAGTVRAEADEVRSEALERYGGGDVVDLVVATTTLEPGDVITKDNARTRQWLADLAPEGSFRSLDEVTGRKVTVALSSGMPVTNLNLRTESPLPDVPEGRVAVTIALSDKLGLAREVEPGTSLAAYASTEKGTRLVASEAEVLAVSEQASRQTSQSGLVTLALSPQDVAGVLSASSAGTLRLVMPGVGVAPSTGTAEALASETSAAAGATDQPTTAAAANVAATTTSTRSV